jgi:putative ABC transport system permease protein
MGIRLIKGRGFNERDDAGAPGVVVISDSVAHRLWRAGDAIGKRISMEDHPKASDWLTIVGVVNDVRQQSLTKKPEPAIYQSYKQMNERSFLNHMSFVVQTSGNPMAMASGIRATIHRLDPDLPTQSIATMESILAGSIIESRSQTRLLGMFSLMALSLAAIGIYGVLACLVVERTHEIGVRMAVGAQERDVVWMVFRRTLLLAGSGVFTGILGALAVTGVLKKFLFEVTPTDPFTFVAVTGLLVTVALFAAWLPARRAARVYPLVALRHE